MRQFSSLESILGLLRRRIGLVVAITILGAVLAALFALTLPRVYETTAMIQIEMPNVQEERPGTSEAARAKYRLQLIEQQVTARDSLLNIADQYGLFAKTPNLSDLKKIIAMRKAVTIEQIVDPADAWRPDVVPSGLLITVRLGDPQKTADVANTILASILEYAESRQEEQAREALSFFVSEEARVGVKITALEAEIAEFKQSNSASMPAGVVALRDQLTTLRDSELAVETQIVGLRAGGARVRLEVANQQISELEQQRDLIRTRIADVQAALLAAPQVERNYSALARELEQLKSQFTVITTRKAEAEMGQMLESRQQDERFTVLETALVPDYPVAPSRKKIVALGAFVALLLGGGLAAFLELLKPGIRTAGQMELELGVTPIVEIPVIEAKYQRRRRSFTWLAVLMGALAVATAAALQFTKRTITTVHQRASAMRAAARS